MRRDLPPKTGVLGVASGSHAKAHPLEHLTAKGGRLHDLLGGGEVEMEIGVPGNLAAVVVGDGTRLEYVGVYGFVWQAFYPHAQVAHRAPHGKHVFATVIELQPSIGKGGAFVSDR